MIAAILIVSLIALVAAECDTDALTKCSGSDSTYTKCVTDSAGDKEKLCDCFGGYIKCYQDAGCPWPEASKKSCVETSGCTEAQCSDASSVAVGVAAVLAVAARFL